ncbi:MAG: sulfur carrier protein ThiS [Lishizhenia sp.]
MNVKFNGNELVNAPATLFELLEKNNLDNKNGIAVAINNAIVPRTNWKVKELKENDSVVVITATAGG